MARICSRCGQQIADGAAFCASCGNPAPAEPQDEMTSESTFAVRQKMAPMQSQNNQSQPQYGPSQPQYQYNPSQPQYGPSQPQYGPSQPQYGPSQPQYGPAQPQYGPAQPQYDPSQPQYGTSQPQYDPSQPQYGPTAYGTNYYGQNRYSGQGMDNRKKIMIGGIAVGVVAVIVILIVVLTLSSGPESVAKQYMKDWMDYKTESVYSNVPGSPSISDLILIVEDLSNGQVNNVMANYNVSNEKDLIKVLLFGSGTESNNITFNSTESESVEGSDKDSVINSWNNAVDGVIYSVQYYGSGKSLNVLNKMKVNSSDVKEMRKVTLDYTLETSSGKEDRSYTLYLVKIGSSWKILDEDVLGWMS